MYTITEQNNLFGYISNDGKQITPAIYKEAHPFSCGLAMVRNGNFQYAYINEIGGIVVPFGLYNWCDALFTCGFARVINKNNKWIIINTLGEIVTDKEYDKIWTINQKYISEVNAYIGEKVFKLNLEKSLTPNILFDLMYIRTFSIEEYKILFKISTIYVKVDCKTKILFFTNGIHKGEVATNKTPNNPNISIVSNSCGQIFMLLHEKDDVNKSSFVRELHLNKLTEKSDNYIKKTSFEDYENDKMNEDWNDPSGDISAYNDGWSQDDVESGLSDAYEGDINAYDRW